jgi:hypothetical protein
LTRENELSDFETAFILFQQRKATRFAHRALAVELESRSLGNSFRARVRAANRVFWSYYRIFRYIASLDSKVIFHFFFHKLLRYLFVLTVIPLAPVIICELFRISPFLVFVILVPQIFRVFCEGVALFTGGLIALSGKEYKFWTNRKF